MYVPSRTVVEPAPAPAGASERPTRRTPPGGLPVVIPPPPPLSAIDRAMPVPWRDRTGGDGYSPTRATVPPPALRALMGAS